jgi:RNA-directed DNA polymerase
MPSWQAEGNRHGSVIARNLGHPASSLDPKHGGVLEDGRLIETTEGTPQGSVASPLLANVYLHYVYDLWVAQWPTRCSKGDMIVVRYADDTIVGFQYRQDAERFQIDLKERLAKFALSPHPEKARLLEFGRYAAGRRAERGQGKPETFDFLGLAHYCSTRGVGWPAYGMFSPSTPRV